MVNGAASFTTLWRDRGSTLAKWKVLQDAADDSRDEERDSCVRIQKLWRGQRVRAWVSVMRAACVEIERAHRGHRGRAVFAALRTLRDEFEEGAVYHYHAMLCQRTFRGYYSRRYKHDFNARKAYIQSVVEKGEELRAHLARNHAALVVAERAEDEERRREEFKAITQHLHHLISTKSIPGVYNSPYEHLNPPSAMGVPIETHLTTGIKDLLKLRDYTRHTLERDLNGTARIPVPYDGDKRSLQASSEYDAPLVAARMEAKLQRVAFVGAAELRGGQRVRDPPYQRGISEGSQFFDPWRNPYMQRGIPRVKEDLDYAASTLGKAPARPFYSSVGGNKSTAHANGRFDVILAAEKNGGVTRRHLALASGCVTREGDFVPPSSR